MFDNDPILIFDGCRVPMSPGTRAGAYGARIIVDGMRCRVFLDVIPTGRAEGE